MRRPAALLLALALLLPLTPTRAEEAPLSRAAFTVLLWQSAGGVPWEVNPCYADVDTATPGAAAICWAHDLGLSNGTGGGLFAPERPITREEAAVLLRRWGNCLGRDTGAPLGLSLCNDNEGISPWADDSLYWATSCGLIEWSPGGLLDPQGTLTATQAQAVLERFSRGFGDAHA